MPSRPPTISRRRLLAGAAALAALGASAETLTACGAAPAPPPDLDDLTTALDRARSDSKLATDAVAAARGSIADTLTEVASVRSAHGEALADEIVRLTGAAAPTTTVITTTTTSSPPAPAHTVSLPAPPSSRVCVRLAVLRCSSSVRSATAIWALAEHVSA